MEVKDLQKLVLKERIGRLVAERNAAMASIAAMDMRIPMIEQEIAQAKKELEALSE